MREIITGVNRLAIEELFRANKKNPLFHSDHEAMAVIDEEVTEMNHEAKRVRNEFESFRECVFKDYNEQTKDEAILRLRRVAVLCACEAIQTAAMCDKYFMGKENEK